MDSYELGRLVGKITFWVFMLGVFWLFYSLVKAFFRWLFKNPTKELLKTYLWWYEFGISLDISSMDDFKKELKKINSKKIYQGEFKNIYLTKNEAKAISKEFKELKVKEILKDEVSLLALAKRLERLTLYDKEDLKNIKRGSKMIWRNTFDIDIHMIIKDKKIIYPKSYPLDSPYRFGYEVFRDESSLLGIYDVEADELKLEFKYISIDSFGNIVEVSEDEKTYEIYDLKDGEIIETNDKKTFPNISGELREKIDLSKIELQDYLKLFLIPKSMSDLHLMGLWGAKVGVHDVPTHYKEILEDSQSGTIEWNQYCSADIFDMSVELPVNFKKKDGDYVSLGINPKYLILEKESRQRIKTKNQYVGKLRR